MGGFSTPSGGGGAVPPNIPLMNTGGNIVSGLGTQYLPFFGTNGPTAVEVNTQMRFPAGTIKRLRIYISGNTSDGSTVYTIRKNGIDTTLTLTIPAAGTGDFFDDVHTENVALNDLLDCKAVPGGSVGSIFTKTLQIDFSST